MRLLLYSVLRVLLLLGALGLGYLLGLRSWLLVLVAVVIAAALSYLFLRGPRDAAVGELAAGFSRPRADRPRNADEELEDRLDEQTRGRDDDAARGSQGQG